MKKASVLILCLVVFVGLSACKRTLLPDNASQFIEKIEALSKESGTNSDKNAINAQKMKIGELLAEGKKIGDALPGPLQKIFMGKINSIIEKINTQKESIQ